MNSLPSFENVAQNFERDGFVHLPGVVGASELAVLQRDSAHIIESAWDGEKLRAHVDPQDYFVDPLPETGQMVFNRVQYFLPKAPENSLLALLGHPYLLGVAAHLLGEDFLPAAEALVFKMPGNGREVAMHADCDPFDARMAPLVFNVDVYLDDSSLENGCLWVEPGSHKTVHQMAPSRVFRGLDFEGMIPVPVKAGDVILHNVRVIHGSPRSSGGALRRTLYYEFQSAAAMLRQGGPRPENASTPEFIRDRFRLIGAAINERQTRSYARNETPFNYQIPQPWAQNYKIEMPRAGESVNLRPALGYSKYI